LRPLTPRRVFLICAALCGVLFVAVVTSLRMGAYPISVPDIVMTLFNGTLGRWEEVPSEFRLVVFGLRLPRIALGLLVFGVINSQLWPVSALETMRAKLSDVFRQLARLITREGDDCGDA
jgi:hypothetical protein